MGIRPWALENGLRYYIIRAHLAMLMNMICRNNHNLVYSFNRSPYCWKCLISIMRDNFTLPNVEKQYEVPLDWKVVIAVFWLLPWVHTYLLNISSTECRMFSNVAMVTTTHTFWYRTFRCHRKLSLKINVVVVDFLFVGETNRII